MVARYHGDEHREHLYRYQMPPAMELVHERTRSVRPESPINESILGSRVRSQCDGPKLTMAATVEIRASDAGRTRSSWVQDRIRNSYVIDLGAATGQSAES